MAKLGVIKTDIVINMEFSEEEILYLRAHLQNYHGSPEDESINEKRLRSDIFHALPTASLMRGEKHV